LQLGRLKWFAAELMVADWSCTREQGKDAEAPERAPETLETVPRLDSKVLAALAIEVRGPTAWNDLLGIGKEGAPMQNPVNSFVSSTESRNGTASSVGSIANSFSETVAARRRANRLRLLGTDGVFVGECKGGFCSTDCSRCAPRSHRVAAGLVAGQTVQPSARA